MGWGEPVARELGEVFGVDVVEVVQVGTAAPVVGGVAGGVEPAGGEVGEVEQIGGAVLGEGIGVGVVL